MTIQPHIPSPAATAPLASTPAINASNIVIPATVPNVDFWQGFGLVPVGGGSHRLAPNVIAFEATDQQAAMIDFMKTMGVPALIAFQSEAHRQALYRVPGTAVIPTLERAMPAGVRLVHPGETIRLPQDWKLEDGRARSVSELSELTTDDIARVGKPGLDPVLVNNPLLPFSLRGQSERFQKLAIEATPLLGEVCLRGQVTIWYAAPGTGKTLVALSLILDAVRAERIAAGNVFYVNADDNGQGFATKLQIMDDIGGNTLAPGFKGFHAPDLITLLHKMADRDEARGALIVIDTIKKFASLMDKKESSAFAQACRRVAMMGGTVLGLAHVTKNLNIDGTPRYAGTSDLVDDADAAYTLRLITTGGKADEKAVEFHCFKSRGDCAETAAYTFAAGRGVSYEEKLASVALVDPTTLDEFKRVETQTSDAAMIQAVAACITEGINNKMALAREVALRTNSSGREAIRVIERYTGDDPAQHRWRFRRGDRAALLFELLPTATPPT